MPVPAIQKKNPLVQLGALGQSVWLDYIRRSLIASGELKRLVQEDGLRGVTSNPAIFANAITGSADYTAALARLQKEKLGPVAIYERLAIEDIQGAADVLKPVYDKTKRRDGYVSLEVSPFLAHDRAGTVSEGLRLWKAVGRDNLMIKVPATEAGVSAVEELIAEGVNVNVTLLFARRMYERVAWAYVSGLERALNKGVDLSRLASVASFFVSRIDTAVDALLDEKLEETHNAKDRVFMSGLKGKAAIANAKLAYGLSKEILRSERWSRLEEKGARGQRLLWASTGVKNPDYSDVMYVEALIGPNTVDTVPPATLDAFRDRGRPRLSLEEDMGEAVHTLRYLEMLGISLDEVTDELLTEGVKQFAGPFQKVLDAVGPKKRKARPDQLGRMSWKLPDALEGAVAEAVEDWGRAGGTRRLWARDASLWTGSDEANWLGWLDIVDGQLERRAEFQTLHRKAREEGLTHAVLLGMGGSSLGPEVMALTFGNIPGSPALRILDSTDPAQAAALEKEIDFKKTFFIVSSKSGGTLEPDVFARYFLARAREELGSEAAGRRFIAITDPGSKLEDFAEQNGFRRVFHGRKTIGGRYSALSDFGMVPAAAMGMDVPRFLDRACEMVVACSGDVPAENNPAVRLGLLLGHAARQGRDKLTIVASPALAGFGAWLEQLVAESTGKEGKGIVVVDREPLGAPSVYGEDRLFVYVRLETLPDASQDDAITALERAGQPVARVSVADVYDLGQEFFRWELASAVAGAVLGINPFNQPDVEASKIATRKLTDAFERSGTLPPEPAPPADQGKALVALLKSIKPGDYFALLAYVAMTPEHEAILTEIRTLVRDKKRVATCVGFGPRFLHSTGQLYKGGPNTGVFLQLTCEDAKDLPVHGRRYTFGVVKAAQARGDLDVLKERKRRALRVHLGADVAKGLKDLRDAVKKAMGG